MKNDAMKIIGIEGREKLVENSYLNMKKYNMPREKYSFICGNIFEELDKIKPDSIDVVFCFGIFYHIMNHMLLISKIKRLNPKYLILDTVISKSAEGDLIAIGTWLVPLILIVIGTLIIVRKKPQEDELIVSNKISPFEELPTQNNANPILNPPNPVIAPINSVIVENKTQIVESVQTEKSSWNTHYDETGRKYYSNSETGETSWTEPS